MAPPPLFSSTATPPRRFDQDHPLVVRLRGGAGNQLFQWAAARSLAEPDAILAQRSSTLDQLAIDALLPDVVRFAEPTPIGLWDRVIDSKRPSPRAALAFATVSRSLRRRTYSQRGRVEWAYEPRPARFRPPTLLDGYFQHPTWLNPGGAHLVDELLLNAPPGFDQVREQPFGVVCTRRGDYEQIGLSLPSSYYRAALAAIPSSLPLVLVGDDQRHLMTLADQLTDSGRVVLRPAPLAAEPAVNDFWLTAAATNVVMANSTFSWWATTVGDRVHHGEPGRSVQFPSKWVGGHGVALRAASWLPVESA